MLRSLDLLTRAAIPRTHTGQVTATRPKNPQGEWNEAIISPDRGLRGGGFDSTFGPYGAGAAYRILGADPSYEDGFIGFRVASQVPEPGTGFLLSMGLLGLSAWRRRRC